MFIQVFQSLTDASASFCNKINDRHINIINAFLPFNIEYLMIYSPVGLMFPNPQYTVVTNLDQSEDIIFDQFYSKTRNEIRKALKELKPVFRLIDKPTTDDVNDFMEKYRNFSYDKNCIPIINVLDEVDRDIRAYCDAKVLRITQISSENISDTPLVYHAYLVDADNLCVRLMCSISCFRHIDSKIQHDIGRLNRLLHFEDIKCFKNQKLKLYDWGGGKLNRFR